MLNEAKYFLSRGISVIPVMGREAISEDGYKKPAVNWKEYQQRLPSMTEIENWFKFKRYNLAMVTGQVSRVLTLDIDSKKGGLDSIKSKFIPLTWTDRSPNGLHYHFIWTPTLNGKVTSYSDLLPGVDIRGDGGYVIIPPSVGFNGQPYSWVKPPINTPLTYPPSWLVDLLLSKQQKKTIEIGNKQGWIAEALIGLKEGNRDNTFIRIAGRLWHDGFETQDIFEVLKPHAEKCGFELEELQTKVKQITKYDRKVGEYIADEFEKDRILTLKELLSDHTKDVEWQIDKILPKEGKLLLAGKEGIGKSFLALDLCIELAKGGGSWLNRFAVNPGIALYIDEENGASLLKQRVKAMLKAKGITKIPENLHLCIEHNYKLDNEKSLAKLAKKLEKINPQIVILDSFRRFHNRNDNDSDTIALIYENIKKLTRIYKCAFIILDHERKSPMDTRFISENPSAQDVIGSRDKSAAADVVINMKEKRGELYIYHTKARYSKPFLPVLVQIEDDEQEGKIQVRGY